MTVINVCLQISADSMCPQADWLREEQGFDVRSCLCKRTARP